MNVLLHLPCLLQSTLPRFYTQSLDREAKYNKGGLRILSSVLPYGIDKLID